MPRIKSSTKASVKPLLQERDRLYDQMNTLWEQAEALRNHVAGIERAIELIEQGEKQAVPTSAAPASNIKVLLLQLAKEAGAAGLNANVAVEMAAKRNIMLKRGTAASNLSRLKADRVLIHDGDRYRLPEFIRPQIVVHAGGKSS